MTKQDYITTNADGWFVGGAQATTYHGRDIVCSPVYKYAPFDVIKLDIALNYGLLLEEFHCMQSSTPMINDGEEPMPSEYGSYGYGRLMYKTEDGETKTTNWGLFKTYDNSKDCLATLFFDCNNALTCGGDNSLKTLLLGQPLEQPRTEYLDEYVEAVNRYRATLGETMISGSTQQD